jgi:hypothetical protein
LEWVVNLYRRARWVLKARQRALNRRLDQLLEGDGAHLAEERPVLSHQGLGVSAVPDLIGSEPGEVRLRFGFPLCFGS